MRRQGFTLIELLVTLAVLAILATVAVPGFQRMMATNRVVADYNEILTGLNFARSEAVKRRAPVQFVASSNGVWEYSVSIVGGGELRSRSGRDGRTSLTGGTVVFNALGRRESCNAPNGCMFSIASEVAGIEERRAQVGVMGRVGKPIDVSGDSSEDSEEVEG